MPNGRGKNKSRNKRRTHRVSKGVVGAAKHPLTAVQKVLLGKGQYQSFQKIGARR